ncbi:PAS domain S-box protein [Marivita sp.]|uniref:PAS domain S-box protein n=1 Tax=Marivita sp. TaxID=2003365 RepID=UPI0025BCF257|nr:PAS domain S-box protein [Marivita sp.]
MTQTEILAAITIATVLCGLIAALVALQRLHRRVRDTTRRILDTYPSGASPDPSQQRGIRGDLIRIEQAFGGMSKRLAAQRATLDQAGDLSGFGTWALLPNLRSVRASLQIRKVFGFPEDEDVVSLDGFRETILPEDRPGFDAALERAVKERVMTDVEFRAYDGDGQVRVFWASTGPGGAVPMDTEGATIGTIQDITELRQTETALVRSQNLERLACETAQIGGWRYDTATRKFDGTPEAAQLLGLEHGLTPSVEDLTNRFTNDEERQRIERSFWTCVGTGSRHDEIAQFQRFDGEETWLRMVGEAERDSSGKIVSVYGALQDVSELVGTRRVKKETQALLQTIVNALDDGFVIHDCAGNIQYMNRMAHSILGVPDTNLVGGNIWNDIPFAHDPLFKRMITDALETGTRQSFEGAIAGPERWVSVAVYPTPAGVAIHLTDLTEEHDSRARLRLLDAAMTHVGDVVLITEAETVDPPGPKVVYVNDAFERITGFAPADILGATPRILQGPDTERARLEDIRMAIENNKPIRTELTNYRKDGTKFTTEININPVFDDEGNCTHYVSIQRDTTKRRADEECLRAREEQFRLASLASQDIIWDWDLCTGTIWNSNNSETVFGPFLDWKAYDAPGSCIEHALERIHPDDRLGITESLDAALSGDAQIWRCDYRIKTKDGTWRDMADKAFIVRDDAGTPRRMVGAMSDVTDLRLLDAQLHQAQKLETVGQLTGGIAHDFNNLLTIILGNCDILLNDIGNDSPLRPLLQSIEDAAERGGRVSRDLLAFSRRQPLELRPTDINKLIRQSANLVERAVDASVEIRYDLSDADTVANVDPDKMQAALLNLVINSRAAIPHRGTITIRTREESIMVSDLDHNCQPGAYIEIDVEDDGSGMSPNVVAHAFDPFFTTKDLQGGTGLGLSSVYGLVKQSGGHATISSEPGKGTIVTLFLPVADEPEQEEPTETDAIAEEPRFGGEHRILVVEDDAELRTFVCTVLTRLGYVVVEAHNGATALNILETDGKFDLIFTDIVMPGGVSGVLLAQKAKTLHPDVKMLFTSGYTSDAMGEDRHVPADIPILSKPFRSDELMAKVVDALANGGSAD